MTTTRTDPAGEQELFHVAPADQRASIETHGLDHARGTSAYQGIDFVRGNYLFTNLDAATRYREVRVQEERDEYGPDAVDYDIWRVTVRPANLAVDPFADDESGLGRYSVFTPEPIRAEHLERLS